MAIYIIDRKTGEKIEEIVAGDRILRWTYDTKPGRFLLEVMMKKKFFTRLLGLFMDTSFSKYRISNFVRDLEINMAEAKLEDLKNYHNFNDFFARELKSEARPICNNEEVLVSPADGRIFAYENIDMEKMVQIKGSTYHLKDLFQDEAYAKKYQGGVCIIVRLNPSDYHRFHFPTEGIPSEAKRIKGDYYSVNPYALQQVPGIYCKNVREITDFHTNIFGNIALVEVGATCVGSILQTYKPGKPVEKGAEKGYFKFGGSTTVLFIEKGYIKVDEDLIKNTQQGLETKVAMGEAIGRRV